MDAFFKKKAAPSFLSDFLKTRAFAPKQKHFITELTNGCLRHYIFLDAVINRFANGAKIRPKIRNILRLGVYQTVFSEKTPPYAAVGETVSLCAGAYGGLKGFVNAVLRRAAERVSAFAQNGNAEFYAPFFSESDFANEREFLSVAYSVPLWIVNMWADDFNAAVCADLCRNQALRPGITICANARKTARRSFEKRLASDGAGYFKTPLPNVYNISPSVPLTEMSSFKDGLFFVIDASACLAADNLRAQNGDEILDACAAPGGKSFYLAQKLTCGITSCDISPAKIDKLRQGRKRLGLDIKIVKQDALVFEPRFEAAFDKVLLDAPCSGLGVLRKKPDIKINKSPADITNLAQIQLSMLKNAARYVKRGGALLYSVCALSKQENACVVNAFLSDAARGGFTLENETYIFPEREYGDGFYTARLKRNI